MSVKFKVGDHVERIGLLVPDYLRNGVVTRVTSNAEGIDAYNEYDVNFGNKIIAGFFETQLRLVKSGKDPENDEMMRGRL